MKNIIKSSSRSAFFYARLSVGLVLCSIGLLLALAGLSKSVTATVRHEATAQTPGKWTATGSMSTARAGSTATLLDNGKILVAGGTDASGNGLASAELYDSGTGTWTLTGRMNTSRFNHTATLLLDGKVLVAGGYNTTATSSAELYDPATGLWTSTGSMNDARLNYAATLITTGVLSGRVLVAGGNNTCGGCTPILDTAELYDPGTGIWSYTGSMTLARFWPPSPASTLPDGSVLVVGGTACCPYHVFNEAETYDPVTQTWTPTSMKMTTANEDAILLSDGRVLVAGGARGTQPNIVNVATAELFDSSTGTWTATGSMSTDRATHTLTLLTSSQVLVAGGSSGGWGVCNDLTSAELYDSSAGRWFVTGNMTVARLNPVTTILPSGQVLAAGGNDCEGNILSSAELYTPPPVAALSSSSLTFGLQLVDTTSAAQTATLTNTGPTTLTIASITTSGDFLETNTCGSSLAPGESCTVNVTFEPTTKGTRPGTLTIIDNAPDSPQMVTLTGIATVVHLSPISLNFGNQKVGTTSPPRSVTLTNTGSTPLTVRGIAILGANFGDFTETTTCGSTVPANSSCAINVIFTPAATGARQASIKVRDDGGGGTQSVKLAGTGTP